MSDIKYIDGLIVKAPHEKAPDYVKCKLSIKRAELIAWLESHQGEWINADVKVSQAGKWYAAVDDWKPDSQRGGSSGSRGGAPQRQRPQSTKPAPENFEDDMDQIPFATNRSVW